MRRAVLIWVLMALLLSGCGVLEEGIEAGVTRLIEEHDPNWLSSWFPDYSIGDLPEEFSYVLAFIIALGGIYALWYTPSDNYPKVIRGLSVILGAFLVPILPWIISIGRFFLGDFKVSEIFKGMGWIESIISLNLKALLVGASWEMAAASITLSLPYYHQAAVGFSVLVFLGCLIVAAIVGHTRPLAFSAVIIVAGAMLFPILFKVWVSVVLLLPRFNILGLYDNSDALNAIYLGGTILLGIFLYIVLPVILALVLPAYDFTGREVARPNLRGAFEGGVASVGSFAGLAGKMPDFREYARNQGQTEGNDDVADGYYREVVPPQLPPPEDGDGVSPTQSNDPDSGGTGGTGSGRGGDILPEAEDKGDLRTQDNLGRITPDAPAAALAMQGEEDETLVQGQRSRQPGNDGRAFGSGRDGILPSEDEEDRGEEFESQREQSIQLGRQRDEALPEQSSLLPPTADVQDTSQEVLEKKRKGLDAGFEVGAVAATALGHPEIGAALSSSRGLVNAAFKRSSSFLPEGTGEAPQIFHQSAPRTPRVLAEKHGSFLPEPEMEVLHNVFK